MSFFFWKIQQGEKKNALKETEEFASNRWMNEFIDLRRCWFPPPPSLSLSFPLPKNMTNEEKLQIKNYLKENPLKVCNYVRTGEWRM